MLSYLPFVVIGIAIVFAVVAGTRWAGERGWVYNKHNPRPPGTGRTLGIFEEMFQPGIEHVVAERASEEIRADQDESGDDF